MIRSHHRTALLLWLCVASLSSTWGLNPSSRIAQYGHTAWRLSDGMFDGTPGPVAQTPDGYLWIGTSSGLLRFDGVRFVPWEGVGGVKLPHGGIHALFTAKDGSLWLGAGASLSHLKNGVLFNYDSSVALVDSIVEDDGGTIWVSRVDLVVGGALCKVSGLTLDCPGPSSSFPFPTGGPTAADHRGNLWVGTGGSYVRWNPTSHQVYSPRSLAKTGDVQGIGAIANAPNGATLIGFTATGNQLGLQEITDGSAKPFPVGGFDTTSIPVTKILFDRRGALWLGTPRGIYRIFRDAVDFYQEKDGLSGDVVSDLLEDLEGDIWVVTSQGLDRLRDLPVQSFGKKEGLTIDGAQSLFLAKDGAVWIVNGNNLEVLRSGEAITIGREPNFGSGDQIGIVTQDHLGDFWIGKGNGLVRYSHGVVHPIVAPAGSPTDSNVQSLAEDASGDMWVAFQPAREMWKVHHGVASRFMVGTRLPSVYDMAFDHKGDLWAGDINGNLARFHGAAFERIPFSHRGLPKAILQLGITDDDAVMGTTAGGVILYKDGKKQMLALENGLPCEDFRSFIFDQAGNLWLTSECGTMEITHDDWLRWREDPQARVKPLLLGTLDGARFSEGFITRAAAQTPDGKVWFANGVQVQMVNAVSLPTNKVLPQTIVEELFADGRGMDLGRNLRVAPLTRQLQINYTATSLSLPQAVLFRYKLEGHDKEWQAAGTRRQAFYNDLKPGTYRFTVLACNNSGLWNEAGSSIVFSVAPAWFQTRWFIAACILTCGTILYGLYQLRVAQVRERLQLQYETRLEERTRVARDLHDTLLQTIQGTKLVAEEALLGNEDPTELHNLVAKIHDWLSRAVLEGRAALTALRSSSSASNLADKLRSAAEECSTGSGMTPHFALVGVPAELPPAMTEEIFRIGYEAIRNACSHSRGTNLAVELVYGRALKLRVKDNGTGFDLKGTSGRVAGHYGIEGMRERAQELGGSLTISSAPADGTEVTLSMRIGKKA